MDDRDRGDSPLEAAAGAAGPHTVEAFELLGDETRLAILLALWEAYEPRGSDDGVPFSALFDRVGYDDTGNFSYHLQQLTDHFVEGTEEGYRLSNAGLKLVQAVIAGTGLDRRTLEPTEIPRVCHRCGARVTVSYADDQLYNICPDCEGNIGPESSFEAPSGTVMAVDFDPAGLSDRTPGAVFVAGTIEFLGEASLLVKGVCPECSGPVERSLDICESHEAPPGEVCTACGTRDELRTSYVCTVCKHSSSFPVEGSLHDHPAVVQFRYDEGIEGTHDLEDPEACARLWEHLMGYEHELLSEDPVRIRVTVPGRDQTLLLTIDGDLEILDVTRRDS